MIRQFRIKNGLEVLARRKKDLLRGKRIGLLSHPAAVTRDLKSSVDVLAEICDLRALYGPEHGIKGDAQAGVHVSSAKEKSLGIPCYSLYGAMADPAEIADLDAYMRDFDLRREGKEMAADMIRGIDLLICDLQDIGTRVYTYFATLALAMDACARHGIPCLVLDRPNPINGNTLAGPMPDFPRFHSFVSFLSIPLRHGMTIGEIALLINAEHLEKPADLTVLPMEGWTRKMEFEETGFPWVPPSPNIPFPLTATVYPGQVLFEGTNLSEGRGTTRPFEWIGAPWLDGREISRRMNQLPFPGIYCREIFFVPTFSKYSGCNCTGIHLHITNSRIYKPFITFLHLISLIRSLHPLETEIHNIYFDAMMGTDQIRHHLANGIAPEQIKTALSPGLQRFRRRRRRFLLYP